MAKCQVFFLYGGTMLILDNRNYFESDGLGTIIVEINSSNPDSIVTWVNRNETGQAQLSNKLIVRKINRLVKTQISWNNDIQIFRIKKKKNELGVKYTPQKLEKFLDSLKNEETRNEILKKYWNVRMFGWEAYGESLVSPCVTFSPGQSVNAVRTFQTKRYANGKVTYVEAIDYALFSIPFYFNSKIMKENRCTEKDIILLLRILHKIFKQKDPNSESFIKIRYAFYIPNAIGDSVDILKLITPPARLFPECSAQSWLDYDADAYNQQINILKKTQTVIDCLELK